MPSEEQIAIAITNYPRLCEAVDFENQIFNLKQKDKMKNKNSNLTQNPPFCKTDVRHSTDY